MKPDSSLKYLATAADSTYEGPVVWRTLLINTNLGFVSSVTSNSFYNAKPVDLEAVVRVQSLEEFKIQVYSNWPSTSGMYTYTWTPTSSVQSNPSTWREQTATNALVLNRWYSIGLYRARFTITAGGKTMTYTQHGDPVSAGMLSIDRTTGLTAWMSVGSDTSVETTTNWVNWSTVTNLPWSMATNRAVVSVSLKNPSRFYRLNSN